MASQPIIKMKIVVKSFFYTQTIFLHNMFFFKTGPMVFRLI